MKRSNLIWALLVSAFFYACQTQPELVWSDEFEGTSLDTAKWTVYVGDGCPQLCGFGNNEKQFYTDRSENVKIQDGKIVITALADSFKTKPFSSAKLITKGKGGWTYGRIEIMARIPSGRGNWPALWMLPESNTYGGWPKSGEIDIMEHVGYDQGTLWGTIHTQSFNHMKGTEKNKAIQVADISDEFHLYAIEWREDRIDWFLDDVKYHSFVNSGKGTNDWPFDQSFI